MKIISIDEFKNLLARNTWHHDQDCEIADKEYNYIEEWDAETETMEELALAYYSGWAIKTSTLKNIKITYSECFFYTENVQDSLQTEHDKLEIEGVAVIDDKGDEIPAHELAEFMDDVFISIDYSVLKIKEVIDMDNDETDSDNEKITIEIDNRPDIRFTGERLAAVKSSANNASSSYSGQPGRWTQLALYKTKGGKYVCHKIGHTIWQGESDSYSGKVCETLDDVKAFFGHGWLAKELYSQAMINDCEEVE